MGRGRRRRFWAGRWKVGLRWGDSGRRGCVGRLEWRGRRCGGALGRLWSRRCRSRSSGRIGWRSRSGGRGFCRRGRGSRACGFLDWFGWVRFGLGLGRLLLGARHCGWRPRGSRLVFGPGLAEGGDGRWGADVGRGGGGVFGVRGRGAAFFEEGYVICEGPAGHTEHLSYSPEAGSARYSRKCPWYTLVTSPNIVL